MQIQVSWVSTCSWHQVSCLLTLFAEPRGGRVGVKKLKEDSRSHRNCRHVYSLLADAADAAIFSPGWPNRHSRDAAVKATPFLWGSHISLQHKVTHNQVNTLWCTCAAPQVISAITQPCRVIVYTTWGEKSWECAVRDPNKPSWPHTTQQS